MAFTALKLSAGSYYIDSAQVFTLQRGNLATNGAVAWENLSNPGIAKFHQAIVDFRSLIASDGYHAWYNQHNHHEKWLDDVNKVVTFEYWDPALDRRRFIVINLTESTYPIYSINHVALPQNTRFEVVHRSGIEQYLGPLPNSAIGEIISVGGELNQNHQVTIPQGLQRYEVVVIDQVKEEVGLLADGKSSIIDQ